MHLFTSQLRVMLLIALNAFSTTNKNSSTFTQQFPLEPVTPPVPPTSQISTPRIALTPSVYAKTNSLYDPTYIYRLEEDVYFQDKMNDYRDIYNACSHFIKFCVKCEDMLDETFTTIASCVSRESRLRLYTALNNGITKMCIIRDNTRQHQKLHELLNAYYHCVYGVLLMINEYVDELPVNVRLCVEFSIPDVKSFA